MLLFSHFWSFFYAMNNNQDFRMHFDVLAHHSIRLYYNIMICLSTIITKQSWRHVTKQELYSKIPFRISFIWKWKLIVAPRSPQKSVSNRGNEKKVYEWSRSHSCRLRSCFTLSLLSSAVGFHFSSSSTKNIAQKHEGKNLKNQSGFPIPQKRRKNGLDEISRFRAKGNRSPRSVQRLSVSNTSQSFVSMV